MTTSDFIVADDAILTQYDNLIQNFIYCYKIILVLIYRRIDYILHYTFFLNAKVKNFPHRSKPRISQRITKRVCDKHQRFQDERRNAFLIIRGKTRRLDITTLYSPKQPVTWTVLPPFLTDLLEMFSKNRKFTGGWDPSRYQFCTVKQFYGINLTTRGFHTWRWTHLLE